MRAGLVLFASALALAPPGRALGLAEPRDAAGVDGEPAPLVRLGPPTAPGARVTPAGADVRIAPSRRSAQVSARFTIEAPPGPLEVRLPSGLFQVRLAADGAELPTEVERREAREPALPEVRIDPQSGRPYARRAPGRATAPAAGYLHRATLTVPPSGRVTLTASAVLSSGYDRRRWRRLLVEQAHLLHARPDFFVYHFAAAGPAGEIRVERPPGAAAQARVEGGALRIAAAARRAFPLGATLALGVAAGSPELPGEGAVVRALGRASLDVLLPWGDALALSGDLATRFADRHQLAAALVYQLYTPTLPFLIVPIGGHLEAGPALDLSPELRPGLRLGLGAHLSGLGLLLSADLFPQRAPPPPGEAGPDRTLLRYRIGALLSLSL